MSKKLFLAAASVAVLTMAGAASAGTISGTVGGVGVPLDSDYLAPVAFTGTASYKIASEVAVSSTNTLVGKLVATNTLTNPIVVAANAQRDHLVTFTVKGGAVSAPTLVGTTAAGSVTSTLLSNNTSTGEVKFLVTVSGTTADAASATALTLNATLTQTSAAQVTVESAVVAVIGGLNIEVDAAPAVKAVEYSPLFKALTIADSNVYTNEASLPDYIDFSGSTAATLSGGYVAVNAGPLYKDLTGATASAVDVLNGATVTVKGPIINDHITVALLDDNNDALGTVTATTDANTAVFTLNAAEAAAFAIGDNYLLIDNDGEDAYRLGKYQVTWTPVAKTNFTVPLASKADSGSITLEGTNFIAPWVSGTGAATSVIRISNSNSVESGAVTVRLINGVKVVGGVSTVVTAAAPYEAGVVPAGGDLQITSAQLVGAFGDFTRGDVQVTINSDLDGFTAKMRNTRDGASFEQSLAD